jgi:hypothetical protein
MTPKEKAEELIDKFSERRKILTELKGWVEYVNSSKSKGHALTAVDEIINSSPLEPNFADWDDCGGEHRYYYDAQKTHALHFWQEVKKEIEKL